MYLLAYSNHLTITSTCLLKYQRHNYTYLPINEPRTPSLFENIKCQKQTSDQRQNELETTNKTPALATDPNGKSHIENKQDTQATRQNTPATNKTTLLDREKENKAKPNNQDIDEGVTDKSNNDKVPKNNTQNATTAQSSGFDGNYGAAVKLNLEQNHSGDKSDSDTTNQSENKQVVRNSDLYMYFTKDGHRRFGRGPNQKTQNSLHEDDTSANVTANEQTNHRFETDYHSQPKQIPVHHTNRCQQNDYKSKYETKSQYQRRTIKPVQSNTNYYNSDSNTEIYPNGHYSSDEPPASHRIDEDEPRFEGIVRRKTIRYYIGNIGQQSNRTGLIKYLQDYGVDPVGVGIIETHRGHLSAKITVYASDRYTMESCITWPKKTYCRRWYGVQQWNTRTDNDSYSNNYYNDNGASSVD